MKTHKKKVISLAILGVLLLGGLVIQQNASARINKNDPVPQDTFRYFDFFATTTLQTNYATTTNATSTSIIPYFDSNGAKDTGQFVIAGAKKVTMFFKRGDTSGQGNAATSTFAVQGTPDGTNWFYISKFLQATSTTVQDTFIAITGTTTSRFGLNLDYDALHAIRCIVVETTDGEHSCSASADF